MKLLVNILNKHRYKNVQQNSSKKTKQNKTDQHIKRITHHNKTGFNTSMQEGLSIAKSVGKMEEVLNIVKSISTIDHINRMEEKNTITSINAEKATD